MLAAAWTKLYGFPRDPRLWVAFVIHDIGYIGKPDMDGEAGESHPYLGAYWMERMFDEGRLGRALDAIFGPCPYGTWYTLTLLHSRFVAARHGLRTSRLYAADKLATALEPWWLYLPRTWATGELREYMEVGPDRYPGAYPNGYIPSKREWFANMVRYQREAAYAAVRGS